MCVYMCMYVFIIDVYLCVCVELGVLGLLLLARFLWLSSVCGGRDCHQDP